LDFLKGKSTKAIVHEFTPLDVKNIRAKIGMTQSEFASAFGISVSTLRHSLNRTMMKKNHLTVC